MFQQIGLSPSSAVRPACPGATHATARGRRTSLLRHSVMGTMAGVVLSLLTGVAAAESVTPGAAIVPADAAFLSGTLRGREQYDLFIKSNAYATLQGLPSVAKALDEAATQMSQPGNPLAMAGMFMQMPENQEALALLQSMVATDTFVYGTPAWVKVANLLRKVQQAQQASNIAMFTKAGGLLADTQAATTRMMVKVLADNPKEIVIPDLVWGFRTSQQEAADTQLKRIEQLLKKFTQAQPMLADAVGRQTIGKGDFVTLTISPDPTLLRIMLADTADELGLDEEVNAILSRVGELKFVVALGRVDDHVILSLGGGTEHLAKLASSGSLLDSEPFKVVRDAQEKSLTGISYISEGLAKALGQSADDVKQAKELAATLAETGNLSEEAKADAEKLLDSLVSGYASRLPVPGPWVSCSYLTDQGYAGEVWNWSQNLPWNGSQTLDLLKYVGGSPVAAIAFRTETDAETFESLVAWVSALLQFAEKHLVPMADDDAKTGFEAFQKHILPLGKDLAETIRSKFLPALKNGQFGLVLDAKSTTTKIQKRLPASADPLPIIEPAIVLAIDDATLFREGLSDLFALSDKLLTAIREIGKPAVPAGYRIPDPEQRDVTGGKLWNFALPESGLDEQIQMSIGVGEKVAVFSLVPAQAERLLTATSLETARGLTAFDSPLAAAAALDWAGLIDAIEPWIIFGARCGAVQNKGERLDPDSTIGPEVETEVNKKDLAQVGTILNVLRCLKSAAAETSVEGEATVTRWQNQISDLPAD